MPTFMVEAEYSVPVSVRAEIEAESLEEAIAILKRAEGSVPAFWERAKEWVECSGGTEFNESDVVECTPEWSLEETAAWPRENDDGA
jgi:hypothetical protein